MPNGVCTVCGTRHEIGANGMMMPVGSGGPRSGSPDPGMSKWLRGESSGDASVQVLLGGAPAQSSGPDSNVEALKKWLTGEERAFDEWLGTAAPEPTASGAVPADVGPRLQINRRRLINGGGAVRAVESERNSRHAEP